MEAKVTEGRKTVLFLQFVFPPSTDINLDDKNEAEDDLPSSKRPKTDETDFSIASLAKGEVNEVWACFGHVIIM